MIPRTKCPKTLKLDCPTCGPWSGWIFDEKAPWRPAPQAEWAACTEVIQQLHDAAREKEFEKLSLVAKT